MEKRRALEDQLELIESERSLVREQCDGLNDLVSPLFPFFSEKKRFFPHTSLHQVSVGSDTVLLNRQLTIILLSISFASECVR